MAAHSKPTGMLRMLLTLFVVLQATAAFHHAGAAHMHPVPRSNEEAEAALLETRAALAKRANNIGIVGASDGKQSPRLEIREMKKNSDQWNLFLLALERFKSKPTNDRTSYYQIAGVHGRPFITWNNYGDLKHAAGFCPHAQTLFGSWHRPYLAVYEQAVYQNAVEVIAQFPADQQQRWNKALVELRIPYWDWAMTPPSGEPDVPTAIRDETVSVIKPQGAVTIKNPLFSYSWGTSMPSEMGWGPSNNYPETLRHPTSSNPPQSNNNEMNTAFGQARVSWRQRVFALFASKKPWGSASTEAIGVQTSSRNSDSFESIHDEIHSTAGGNGGHMSYLDVAAFDPLFWLHHTNIDRLLAMYQLVVPTTYVANGNINRDMAQWNNGDAVDASTPLQPFTKNTNGDVYSSNDIRETRVLGYYYAETSERSYNQVVTAVNNLYGQGETPMNKREDDDTPYQGRPFKEGDYDTVLSVSGDKFAMPGSYVVHCYLGSGATNGTNSTTPVTNTTAPYTNSSSPYGPGYVGSHTFLGGSVANSNSSNPIVSEGSIPLTVALMGKEASGELESLHPDHVEPYLKDHLSYKVIGPNGKEFKPEEIPHFRVGVKSCEVKPATGDELPTYQDYVPLPKVNLPASNPSPSGSSPSSPTESVSYPTGTMPGYGFGEGYCVMEQVINYVDPAGNFLYSSKV